MKMNIKPGAVPSGRRRVLALSVAALGAAGGGALIATVGHSVDAGASRPPDPPTTIVMGNGKPIPPASEATTATLRSAIASLWPDATVNKVDEIVDDRASSVTVEGAIGGGIYDATVYRKFAVEELDGNGLERVATDSGTAWVGANDPDLTSIYFLSSEGVGVRIGMSPPPGGKGIEVSDVMKRASDFAASSAVSNVAREVK